MLTGRSRLLFSITITVLLSFLTSSKDSPDLLFQVKRFGVFTSCGTVAVQVREKVLWGGTLGRSVVVDELKDTISLGANQSGVRLYASTASCMYSVLIPETVMYIVADPDPVIRYGEVLLTVALQSYLPLSSNVSVLYSMVLL